MLGVGGSPRDVLKGHFYVRMICCYFARDCTPAASILSISITEAPWLPTRYLRTEYFLLEDGTRVTQETSPVADATQSLPTSHHEGVRQHPRIFY